MKVAGIGETIFAEIKDKVATRLNQEMKMSLRDKVSQHLLDAMRGGEEVKKQTLRLILAAIKLAEVGRAESISDSEVIAIIQKEIKVRREAISDAEKANRTDLISSNQAEITFLENYLPSQMSECELEELTKSVIEETGASGIADMGKVMKTLLPKIQGRALNDQVSQMVRKLLQP